MKSIKTNPNSAKEPDKGKIVSKLYCILLTTLELLDCVCACTTMFVDEEKVHMAQIETWKNKNFDGFYTKTTQKGGFSKLYAKI
jgi:hypothetical protein